MSELDRTDETRGVGDTNTMWSGRMLGGGNAEMKLMYYEESLT